MPTPHWLSVANLRRGSPVDRGTYIIKSVWEHASMGLDDEATVFANAVRTICFWNCRAAGRQLGGECFAEVFVEGGNSIFLYWQGATLRKCFLQPRSALMIFLRKS